MVHSLTQIPNRLFAASLISVCLGGTAHADWNWTTLSNPNWDISLTDAGYSDYLLDHTPGFVGREYLSGEWGAAIGYSKGNTTVTPNWLEPNFSFPDWTTNSTFTTKTPTSITAYSADGLNSAIEAKSVIANSDLQIDQTFRLVDTVTGTPMGVSAASSGSGQSLLSNRYVLLQSYSITNTTTDTINNLQFFQLLHGLESQSGVFDNRNYAGAYSDYRYDITLNGVDTNSSGGQRDYIGFSSTLAPSAVEIGHYGIEGVDDHAIGKPSVGTHLSIEANNLNNQDNFAPANRWVAGAERWDLNNLAPGETKSLTVMLTLLTGWQVDSNNNSGSGNGGATEIGGLDYEFQGSHSDGQFFISYHQEDASSIQTLVNEGEIGAPTFPILGGKLQLFNVDFEGEFQGLLKLTFGYDYNLLSDIDESLLRVFHWKDSKGTWENLGGIVDPTHHTITVYTDSLSPFAVTAVPLPSAIWLFGSALVGFGISRKRSAL
ncbi:PEP-CTERM sorting domain-containing protein [Methylomonas sp. 2BW1-5-20]|uniref:PEP-CTERM sorting domain-containing protein n=1 Tax=Methylomonas sp. 2BW1-5-20 TaxID=3376686 RepID=UPI00404F8ED4